MSRFKVSILGITVGSITDVGLSGIFGALLMSRLAPAAANLPPEQYQQLVESLMFNDLKLHLTVFIVGGIFSTLGGFVAAKIAKRHELLNGALASFLCVGSGFLSLLDGNSTFPLWLQLLSIIISPLLALLGGYICLRYKNAFAIA